MNPSNASDALALVVRIWAEVQTGHGESDATDHKCNSWKVFRARESIEARCESGRGVLGSRDFSIKCRNVGGITDDEGRALFKVCQLMK